MKVATLATLFAFALVGCNLAEEKKVDTPPKPETPPAQQHKLDAPSLPPLSPLDVPPHPQQDNKPR